MRRIIAVISVLLPWVAMSGEMLPADQRAMTLLAGGESDLLKALPQSEQAVLRATLALKGGAPERALDYLSAGDVDNDPLVSLLKAEAYRRSAVLAVASAGDYARGLQDKKAKLEDADLTPGLAEAEVRLSAFMDRLDGIYGKPLHLLQLASDIQSVFMVDKARSRMFVYERDAKGVFQRVADEYVVTGAKGGDKQKSGDARTPNGVYRFVDRLDDRQLEARYGPVAFPIDYPNELDQLHHKNGYGIWMHGYPEGVDRRPPQDTRGCFALPNDRLLQVAKHVHLKKSWVVVGENFLFDQEEKRNALLKSVTTALTRWQQDWTSLDTEAYLDHYHQAFRSGRWDLTGWKRYKKRVNGSKSFIDVSLSNISLVHDPNRWPEGEVVIAEFDQHYRSNNYQDAGRKRIYLARGSAEAPWRILIEESVAK